MHRKMLPVYVLHVTPSHILLYSIQNSTPYLYTIAYYPIDISKRDTVHSRRHYPDDKTTTICSLIYTACWLEGMA
jgi:hypothetical protein